MGTEECRGFLITGKVQGVYFRHSTRREALRLKLRGYACNLPDGSVEVFAVGAPPALEALNNWLKVGPAQARVDAVQSLSVTPALVLPAQFEVR